METAKLLRMANQIAANLDYGSGNRQAVVEAVADHLGRFWPPDMRAAIIAYHASGGEGLDEVAAQAVAKLGQQVSAAQR